MTPWIRLAALALPLVAVTARTQDSVPDTIEATVPVLSTDEAAVRGAIEDYVLGFYEAAPARIERGVSRDLKKMGFARRGEGYSKAAHMNFEQATELAARWNADGKRGEMTFEIELFEVAGKTACGKLTAHWGIDYFHLVKEAGGWKIHHVLWQTHPPESASDGER